MDNKDLFENCIYKLIKIIKIIFEKIINNSVAYYIYCIILAYRIFMSAKDEFETFPFPTILFLLWIAWKIYRRKNGYKSFKLSSIKIGNITKKERSKDYDIVDK